MMPQTYASKDCQQCQGSGYYPVPSGAMRLCNCGAEEEVQAILANSGIEKRFRDCRFSNYKPISKTQLEARTALLDFTTTFDTSSRGKWLSGDVGTGKTHLACAVVNALAKEKRIRSKFYTVPSFLMALKKSISDSEDGTESELVEEAIEVPLLVLDDVGAERMTDYALEKIYIVIDGRYQAGLPVIITTNLSEDGLKEHLGPRLVSRLTHMTGTPIVIDGPDYRTTPPETKKERVA